MSHSRPHVTFTSTCHFHDYMPLSQKTTCFTKQQHGTTRHYVTLRCITWRRHTTLHESTPHYATLRYITLHYVASLGVVIQTSQAPCLCLIAKPPCWETLVHPARGKRNSFFVLQTHRPAGSHFFNRCPVVDHCCLTQYFLHPKTTHQLVAILSTGGLLSITVARPAQRQFFLRFPETDQLAVVFSTNVPLLIIAA